MGPPIYRALDNKSDQGIFVLTDKVQIKIETIEKKIWEGIWQ